MARGADASEDTATENPDVGQPDHGSASSPRRINVAVTPDMLAAIDRMTKREGVTVTEAVRRLISYGDVVYRSVRVEENSVFFRTKDGKEREVMLI